MKNWKHILTGLGNSTAQLVPYVLVSASIKSMIVAAFIRVFFRKPSLSAKVYSGLFVFLTTALEILLISYPKRSFFSSELRSHAETALTFDDGPSPNITPQILDTLKKYNVTATFFVVADCVERHPELLRRIVAEGHQVGIHGNKHTAMILQPGWMLSKRIEECRRAIWAALSEEIPITLFRPPYGYRNVNTHAAARRSKVAMVLWSIDSRDYMLGPPEQVAAKVLKELHPGAVILMHDGKDNTVSPDALEYILLGFENRGYTSAAMCNSGVSA